VTVNIGFGTNRFLAKTAAGINKPDGLTIINSENLMDIYSSLELIDLTGINVRYRARLNLAGIYTPLDFLATGLDDLRRIFNGIVGYYWYLRLRGHEIDTVDFSRKSFGQQYALSKKTTDVFELQRLIMKLSEKAGRRLRRHSYSAGGISLFLGFENRTYYAKRSKWLEIYSTQDIYSAATKMLSKVKLESRVSNISISVYDLKSSIDNQLNLFTGTKYDARSLAKASDEVNDRYGEFTLVPALMANMQETILKRVAFGKVNDE
jgi:DNA polymerase-4